TTRNRRKARTLARAYDELEARIDHLAEQEEIAKIRPDLDGNRIMEILELPPGRVVGEAYGTCSTCGWSTARSARSAPSRSCAPGGRPARTPDGAAGEPCGAAAGCGGRVRASPSGCERRRTGRAHPVCFTAGSFRRGTRRGHTEWLG